MVLRGRFGTIQLLEKAQNCPAGQSSPEEGHVVFVFLKSGDAVEPLHSSEQRPLLTLTRRVTRINAKSLHTDIPSDQRNLGV